MEKKQGVQSWSLNSPLHLVKWKPLLFPKFNILYKTWVLTGRQLEGFRFMKQGTLGKGWCWTPESWWNACMNSLNLNSDCKCCEMGMKSGIGQRGPIYICLWFHWEHPACLWSQGYLLSARQWLPVPAEMPELQETELAVFQRRANIPWDAAASHAEVGSLSDCCVWH